MRRKAITTLAAVLLPALAGCEPITGPGDRPLTALPRPLTAAEQRLVSANNAFAFGLLRETDRADTAPNVSISSLSASLALGMTMAGARGATLEEMHGALGFTGTPFAEVNPSYRSLIDLLRTLDRGVDVRIANSIWARRDFPFDQAFFQTAGTYFDAEAATLDFDDPKAPATINDWVNRSTNGKIRTIVDGGIPRGTVMYLVNAVYFKGAWAQRFDPARTRDAPFTRADGTRQTVKMMSRSGKVRHMATPDFEAVDLPYGRGAYTMTIVLPAPGTDLDALVATLDAERWQQWTAQLAEREMELSLPRFRMEYERVLNDPLQALGMRRAFQDGGADFTGMSASHGLGLFISEVKQKTYVDVNEEGTEAAAVTSVGMKVTSAPPAFVVDRPFLVAIRERFSGSILFLGTIGAPSSTLPARPLDLSGVIPELR